MAAAVQATSANGLFPAGLTGGNTVVFSGVAYDSNGAPVSSSNPTINGSASGFTAEQLQQENSPGSGLVYETIWILQGVPAGGTQLGLTFTAAGGDTEQSILGWEYEGLPADLSFLASSGQGDNAGPADSGPVTADPLLVLAVSVGYALTVTPPGGWVTLGGNSNFTFAGYQLPNGAGTFDWQTVLSGPGDWAAGIVAITAARGAPRKSSVLLLTGGL